MQTEDLDEKTAKSLSNMKNKRVHGEKKNTQITIKIKPDSQLML